MPVTVKIGQRLSEHTNGQTSFTVEGATLGQLIDQIDALHPGFRKDIFGGVYLHPWILVEADGETILRYAEQPVPEGTVVSIAMSMPGG